MSFKNAIKGIKSENQESLHMPYKIYNNHVESNNILRDITVKTLKTKERKNILKASKENRYKPSH